MIIHASQLQHTKMIDLHSHIIPGIDDGAVNMPEALALLRLAEAQGITRMVATPHIHAPYFNNTAADIQNRLSLLKQAASQAGLHIELAAAAEVRISTELVTMAEQHLIPVLGVYEGQPLILLEMPHSHIVAGYEMLFRHISSLGYRIMLAHPERNRELMTSPEKILHFRRLGCLFQLTAAAVCGAMGDKSQQLAGFYLERGYVSVIASDCHSVKRRPPLMAEAFNWISKYHSAEIAENLLISQPAVITRTLFEAGS